ncbi:type II toxin-antitoxin system VapC family toxin [soil metagenome]
MIILDTNVVSELMKAAPDDRVVDWIDGQQGLFITAVTAAELLYGVGRLPVGQRRSRLADAIAEMLETEFADRVLPFDLDASVEYAHLVSIREVSGRPIGMADAMIAAVAVSRGADLLATRNSRDFELMGISLINPWVAG